MLCRYPLSESDDSIINADLRRLEPEFGLLRMGSLPVSTARTPCCPDTVSTELTLSS